MKCFIVNRTGLLQIWVFVPVLWPTAARAHMEDRSMFVVPFQSGSTLISSCSMSSTPLSSLSVVSLKQCALECFNEPQCVGYNWQESGSTCELLESPTYNLDNLITRSGYQHYSLTESPVSFKKKPK